VYVYRGALRCDPACLLPEKRMAIMANTSGSDGVRLQAEGEAECRALLIAGQPLNEPIVQYGRS